MQGWGVETWITVIGFALAILGGFSVAVYKIITKINEVLNRPRPCDHIKDVEEKLEKHDSYLASDRKRIESLEKSETKHGTQIEHLVSGQASMDVKLDQILMLLIKGKANE